MVIKTSKFKGKKVERPIEPKVIEEVKKPYIIKEEVVEEDILKKYLDEEDN